jgi:threonine synthase
MIPETPTPATQEAHSTPSATLPITLVCHGCGYRLPEDEAVLLTCPMTRPGDNIDHVLTRLIDPSRLRFPSGREPNPFVRYRALSYGYHHAIATGWSDGDVGAFVRRLDARIAEVDGHGFSVTPLIEAGELAARLGLAGTLLVKDETGNVSGSHKARHLFGTLLELEIAGDASPTAAYPLAIASCGNAALAAAVVARAAQRPLRVFIPTDADQAVVSRLRALGAEIVVCPRKPGEAGDPTYRRLLEALHAGAFPFTCQGNLNGMAIEGGMTLGWELVDQLGDHDWEVDHLVVQVGGGALASSIVQSLVEARRLGALARLPRIHTVQTHGAAPLARAVERVRAQAGPHPAPAALDTALAHAARDRSAFMWPWESPPHSIAHGILDDETYDWVEVARGTLLTDGLSLVVDEATLGEANELARSTTGIDADHTGTAGLAGVIELQRRDEIRPGESVAVIFTGVRRDAPGNGGHP